MPPRCGRSASCGRSRASCSTPSIVIERSVSTEMIGAHLLQHVDEVLDLGLDGRVLEPRHALGPDGREEQLLGGADARVGELVLDAPCRPFGAVRCRPSRAPRRRAPNLLEDLEVEVDRADRRCGSRRGRGSPPRRGGAAAGRTAGSGCGEPACAAMSPRRPARSPSCRSSGRPRARRRRPSRRAARGGPTTTATSRISGTLRRIEGASPSSAATIALETKFLAPRTVISPVSGLPPVMRMLSLMPLSCPMPHATHVAAA